MALGLRSNLPAFSQWVEVQLSAANRNMVYVPEGCALGLLTVENETEVFYQMSEFYNPESVRGVCWNDPEFGITCPRAK